MNMIFVTVEKEGIHRWKHAPEKVYFIKNYHRHIFKFKVYIEVFHNDRELEFFTFKNFIKKIVNKILKDKTDMSCEQLSDELFRLISKKFSGRKVMIEVSEDGENGSFKTYN